MLKPRQLPDGFQFAPLCCMMSHVLKVSIRGRYIPRTKQVQHSNHFTAMDCVMDERLAVIIPLMDYGGRGLIEKIFE